MFFILSVNAACLWFCKKSEPIEDEVIIYKEEQEITPKICSEYFCNDENYIEDFVNISKRIIKNEEKLHIYIALVRYLSNGLKDTMKSYISLNYYGPLLFDEGRDKLFIEALKKEKFDSNMIGPWKYEMMAQNVEFTFKISALYFNLLTNNSKGYLETLKDIRLGENGFLNVRKTFEDRVVDFNVHFAELKALLEKGEDSATEGLI